VRTASVDRLGHLWIGLTVPAVSVYDRTGEKTRTVRLEAAGTLQPDSLSFSGTNTLLVTPGCYEFTVW
jgi:sugar lactone lactonase YvrE